MNGEEYLKEQEEIQGEMQLVETRGLYQKEELSKSLISGNVDEQTLVGAMLNTINYVTTIGVKVDKMEVEHKVLMKEHQANCDLFSNSQKEVYLEKVNSMTQRILNLWNIAEDDQEYYRQPITTKIKNIVKSETHVNKYEELKASDFDLIINTIIPNMPSKLSKKDIRKKAQRKLNKEYEKNKAEAEALIEKTMSDKGVQKKVYSELKRVGFFNNDNDDMSLKK